MVHRTTDSWFDSFPVVARLTGLDRTSRLWVPGPMAGTMNLFAAVIARVLGAQLVGDVAGATHAHLTPSDLRRLLDAVDARDEGGIAGLRVTVAGDRLGRALHDRAVAAGAVVSHYYGAAELSFVAWGTHELDLRPFPGVEVVATEGVLWVRSPYLAQVDTDQGFATVGDLGELTDDGRVVVGGRGEAAVITGGATVLVEDVEAALSEVAPGQVAVLGLPHDDLGQVVAAVVTGVSDDGSGLARLREHARAVLPPTHRPRVWFRAEAIPRTPGGKLDRASLRRLAELGRLTRLGPAGPR